MQRFIVNILQLLFLKQNSSNDFANRPLMETDPEEHRLNYERYRTLVMIDCSGGQLTCSLFSLRSGSNCVWDTMELTEK